MPDNPSRINKNTLNILHKHKSCRRFFISVCVNVQGMYVFTQTFSYEEQVTQGQF